VGRLGRCGDRREADWCATFLVAPLAGEKFADLLALFIANETELPPDKLNVWSSTMKRARQTARSVPRAFQGTNGWIIMTLVAPL
jgi:broad specificity phosphatase PhoE